MYYHSSQIEQLAIIETQCPICGKTANMLIGRELDFISLFIIFNLWAYGKFLATCGNCHGSVEIKGQEAHNLLDSVKISYNHSNLKKNIISISIPIIIIYVLIKYYEK